MIGGLKIGSEVRPPSSRASRIRTKAAWNTRYLADVLAGEG